MPTNIYIHNHTCTYIIQTYRQGQAAHIYNNTCREIDKQTDTQTDGQAHACRQRYMGRQLERHAERLRHTYRQRDKHIHTYIHTFRETDTQEIHISTYQHTHRERHPYTEIQAETE